MNTTVLIDCRIKLSLHDLKSRIFWVFLVVTCIQADTWGQDPSSNLSATLHTDTLQAREWLNSGKVFRDSARYDSALICFEKAILILQKHLSATPDNSILIPYLETTNYKGLCLMKRDQYAQSKAIHQEVLDKAPISLGKDHPIVADTYNYLGAVEERLGNLDKAFEHYQMALEIRKKHSGEQTLEVAAIFNNLSVIYGKQGRMNESLNEIQKCLAIKSAILGSENPELYNDYGNLGVAYLYSGNLYKARENFQKGLDMSRQINGELHPETARGYNNVGVASSRFGDLEAAMEAYQKSLAIKIARNGENSIATADQYYNIGIIYLRQGLYAKAVEYINKTLSIQLTILGETHSDIGDTYNILGLINEEQGAYEKSLDMHQKALSIRKASYGETHHRVGETYSNLGIVFKQLGEYQKALDNANKALAIKSETFGANSAGNSIIHNNIGNIYDRMGRYELAMGQHLKALEITRKESGQQHPRIAAHFNSLGITSLHAGKYKQAIGYFEQALPIKVASLGEQHHEVALIYNNLGNAHRKLNEHQKALPYFQLALNANSATFQLTDWRKNPYPSDVFFSKLKLLESLVGKAKTLEAMYAMKSFEPDDLLLAHHTYETALQRVTEMRKGYGRQKDREELLKNAYELSQGAIRTAIELYQATQEDSFAHRGFRFCENSRAILLLEGIQQAQAKSFAGVPDSLVEREEKVASLQSYYQKYLFNEQLKAEKADSIKIGFLQQKIFRLNKDADSLHSLVQTRYPQYHSLKYDIRIPSMDEIQHNLIGKGAALVEYFIGDDFIYAFYLDANGHQVERIPKDFPLEQWVGRFHKSIFAYHTSGQRSNEILKAKADTFATYGSRLYEKIFAPLLANHSLPEKLIIIPDGVLGYIPFEILITGAPNDPMEFSGYPYLIRQHQISYCYSATLLEEMTNRTHANPPEEGFLAFAPSFEGHNGAVPLGPGNSRIQGLAPLLFNIQEVTALKDMMGGKAFTGTAATEGSFLARSPHYRILHLATHGKANDKMGDYSFLAFAEVQDSLENEFMFTRDLYSLRLNADMVVLSACETGLGELKRGEGIISLARGFSYAGAKNILTTLWSINDWTTRELMKNYYAYILEGRPKDLALRQAKLDFIQSHPGELSHPFFWGAFVSIGDQRPIQMGRSSFWIWFSILLALAGLAAYGFMKKKRFTSPER